MSLRCIRCLSSCLRRLGSPPALLSFPYTTLFRSYDAIYALFLEDVGTLFVVDNHSCLIGVLSRKDLLRASIGNQDLNKVPVHMIMTRMPNVTICDQDDLLIDAAQKLITNQIDGLPVIKDTKNGPEVIGRITKTTVTKVFVELVNGDQF